MKTKSICLLCRGAKIKLGAPCLGCEGHGWVYVNVVTTARPEPVFNAVEKITAPKPVKLKPAIAPLPPPEENRRALGVRVRTASIGLQQRIIAAVQQYQETYLLTMNVLDIRPMLLSDIAKIVGCDLVTVHNNLRHQLISGVEARSLFSEAVCGVSRLVVMQMMKDIVANEHTPYSDSNIQQHLAAKGINISRRTVTKYRLTIKIPSGSKRKKHENT